VENTILIKILTFCISLTNLQTEYSYPCAHIYFKFLVFCSKKREVVPDLAPMLWHSFGTVSALLQEIVNIYPAINPPHLTVRNSTAFG
jgi:cytochrome bd-type quinol oxidase subunit 2